MENIADLKNAKTYHSEQLKFLIMSLPIFFKTMRILVKHVLKIVKM